MRPPLTLPSGYSANTASRNADPRGRSPNLWLLYIYSTFAYIYSTVYSAFTLWLLQFTVLTLCVAIIYSASTFCSPCVYPVYYVITMCDVLVPGLGGRRAGPGLAVGGFRSSGPGRSDGRDPGQRAARRGRW